MFQNNAGEDFNFSWDECKVKERQLHILWNIHKLLINLAKENHLNPFELNPDSLALEEKYILSKLHSTIKEVSNLMEEYRLDEIIAPLEELFLHLSRTYIQMVRDKTVLGTENEKKTTIYTIATVLLETLKMFSIVAPFISEAVFLNLQDEFNLEQESISHYSWPKADNSKIDSQLEEEMEIIQNIIQSALSAREKANRGLRWPISEMVVVCRSPIVLNSVNKMKDILKTQINLKEVKCSQQMEGVTTELKPNPGSIGKAHAALSPKIIAKLNKDNPQKILDSLDEQDHYTFKIDGKDVRITSEMLIINRTVPQGFVDASSKHGTVYLNTETNKDLESEGYAREVMRQVQQLRKDAKLEKTDQINLAITASDKMEQYLEKFSKDIKDKVGAVEIEISINPEKDYPQKGEFSVKNEKFIVEFEKV